MLMHTYHNPVYAGSFPDPFVLKHAGEYWAYCTGDWPDGRRFGVMHSRDLLSWKPLAGALEPLPEGYPYYWAPEVVYDNGRFYMYYSAGDELNVMMVRVAVAEHPAGPFIDSGHALTTEPFAIDAHVFVDDDGARYLFYATDYLEHTHVGTGTAMARLRDHWQLAEAPHPVTRARYDWQVYDPQRKEKGGVRWHTVEGPFVLKRKGRYYQMFSGGNWQNLSYGVSYATTERIDAPGEWEQHADGERVLPILRTIPGRVVGPGHNSVVRGPDNMQLFCVYHRWSASADARQLAIDPLDWAGERMLTLGPSDEERPLPQPSALDFFDAPQAKGLGPAWECLGGSWSASGGEAIQSMRSGEASATFGAGAPCFVAEVSLRATGEIAGDDALGLGLIADAALVLRCAILPARELLRVSWMDAGAWREELLRLPEGFAPQALHLLRVEVDGARVRIALDDIAARWRGLLTITPERLALVTAGGSAAFSGFALTVGWEELFDEPEALGWAIEPGSGWRCEEGRLRHPGGQPDALIVKGPPLEAYELLVNARVDAEGPGGYGICPAVNDQDLGPRLTVEPLSGGWALRCQRAGEESLLRLPEGFDPYAWQQFRLRKSRGQIDIAWERHALGSIPAPTGPSRVGLLAHQAAASFDMVRVTAIS
jgi:GH43 family beta-xylosidase